MKLKQGENIRDKEYHKEYKMKLKKKQMQDEEYHKEYKMKLKVRQNPLFSICI